MRRSHPLNGRKETHMARVVTAAFSPGCRFTQAQGSLWQYDYGTVLHLTGLELPAAVEIHFATVERGGESETRIGVTADGITEVKIPDALLEMGKDAGLQPVRLCLPG